MPAELVSEAQESVPSTQAPVRLVPAFDQYVIAATRHAANLLPGPFKERVYRAQGWLSPMVLVEGRMDGVWRHERKGDRLVVEVEPFADLSPAARHGVEEEAERLAGFLAARWTWPGVGPPSRYHLGMSKTSVEIDQDIAREAAAVLGTKTLRDTIDAALREVVHAKRRLELVALLGEDGRFDFEAAEQPWGTGK